VLDQAHNRGADHLAEQVVPAREALSQVASETPARRAMTLMRAARTPRRLFSANAAAMIRWARPSIG
jgi:hypothetical protein